VIVIARQNLRVGTDLAEGQALAERPRQAPRDGDADPAQQHGTRSSETFAAMTDRVSVRVSLPRAPASVPVVRALVRGIAGVWEFDEPLAQDIELVASELSTNAVLHGAASCLGCFDVRLVPQPHGLRIEVADAGAGSVGRRPPSQTAESGRGLLLVSRLCESWGVHKTRRSTVVWAEIRSDAP
jgi:anti-sigma regulatory factor (Ser/Thr protein kinase)